MDLDLDPDGIRKASSALAEENRRTLRRTLAIVSWLYAGEHALAGPALLLEAPTGAGLLASRTLFALTMGHLALLVGAALGLPKPRPWGWPLAFAAAAGAGFLSVLLFAKGNAWSGLLEAVYALLVLTLSLKSR